MPPIRITEDVTFPTDPRSKSNSDFTTFEKGCEFLVYQFCYGAAVLQDGQGGVYLIPSNKFEIVKRSKERTYSEAEVKAIRDAWEEKWILQQNRLEWAESGKSYWESQAKREREHGYAKQRKLDLLAPEIQQIEKAINRIVPDNAEGTLAEHVEKLVDNLLMVKQARQNGPKIMRDINAIIAEGHLKGHAVFIETEHPEDVYIRQQQESKPRRPVRRIR